MDEKYHTKLRQTVRQQFRRDKVVRNLNAVQEEIESEMERVDLLKASLSKETADVEVLERASLQNLVQTVMGKKKERLEKEQSEQMAADIKYKTAVSLLEIMESEKQGLLKELESLNDVEETLAGLLADKSADGNEMYELAKHVAGSHANLREIAEALEAGEAADHAFEMAIGFLTDAQQVGVLDIIGGGFLASFAKQSNVKEAQKYVEEAHSNLRWFNRELHDVDESTLPEVEMGDVARFADLFFDGLFTDLFAQKKINESIAGIEKAWVSIEKKVQRLEFLQEREMANAEELEQRWEALNSTKS